MIVGQSRAFNIDKAMIIANAVFKSGIMIPPNVWVIAKKRITSNIRKIISFIILPKSFLFYI